MKKKYTFYFLFLTAFLYMSVWAKNDGGPPYNTKAPGEKSCSGTEGANSCHSGGIADNSGPATLSIIFDGGNTTYIPGQTYTIKPRITHPTFKKFGFQIVSLRNSDNKFTGTITLDDTNRTRMQQPTWGAAQDRKFVMHRIAGTSQVSANTGEWTYKWKAPATNEGAITFYASYVAANDNNSNDVADQVYWMKQVINAKNVGIEPPVSTSELFIYPNPAADDITIEFNLESSLGLRIQVTDLNGKVVHHTDSRQFNSGKNIYTLSSLNDSPGVYMVHISGENYSETRKIIVQ